MNKIFTNTLARNTISGSVLTLLLFLALTFGTVRTLPERDHRENLTPIVALGKAVWEQNNCIGCHTLLGEGAYYAPELGNVYQRIKQQTNEPHALLFIKAWVGVMPTEAPMRRQMPNFNLSEEELEALVAFLKWTSEVNTADWPPNIEG